MRVPAALSALCFLLSLPAVLPAQNAPAFSRSAEGSRLYYYVTPRSALETEVHTVPPTDGARFDRLKALFADKGCDGDQLRSQPVNGKNTGPANLICIWPGSSDSTVVVLAEYQHQGKGQGAVENWSGAALLPCLYFAMQARPRENTWVFVESAGKSGAASYLRSLSGEQKKKIRAMVAINSLGLSPALPFYSPNPESIYLPAAVAHLQMTLALATLSDRGVPRPQALSPYPWLPSDDTQPFRYSHVPGILLDSVSEKDARVPGSARDTAAAIDGNAYYMNYRAIAVFLTALDALAAKLRGDDALWHGEQGQFHLNGNDFPPGTYVPEL